MGILKLGELLVNYPANIEKNSNDESWGEAFLSPSQKIVYVNHNAIPPGYLGIWLGNYETFLVSTTPNADGHYEFLVDNYIIYKNDCDQTILAQWLNDNDQFIDFAATYPLIENIHKMIPREVEFYSTFEAIATVTYGQFMSEIFTKKGNTNIDYNCFVDIDLDLSAKTYGIDLPPYYNAQGNFFSIPFLKSLKEIHSLDNATQIEFREVEIFSMKSIVISFKDANGENHYYDFSQNPLKLTAPTKLTTNLFSCL